MARYREARKSAWWLRAPGVEVSPLYFDEAGNPGPPLGVTSKDPA